MSKLVERAQTALALHVDQGEELKAAGLFLRADPIFKTILLQMLWPAALKYYFVGVTDKRLILVRCHSISYEALEETYSVPSADVEVKGQALLLKLPGEVKRVTLGMDFSKTGFTVRDANEFMKALSLIKNE